MAAQKNRKINRGHLQSLIPKLFPFYPLRTRITEAVIFMLISPAHFLYLLNVKVKQQCKQSCALGSCCSHLDQVSLRRSQGPLDTARSTHAHSSRGAKRRRISQKLPKGNIVNAGGLCDCRCRRRTFYCLSPTMYFRIDFYNQNLHNTKTVCGSKPYIVSAPLRSLCCVPVHSLLMMP